MSAPGRDLARLQRWMQAVITHPGGVSMGVASEAAREGLEVAPGAIDAVIRPSATLTGAERLAVYGRSYRARLLACFQTMFPALCHALGEELLNRFAIDYLARHPPSSFTLSDVANGFPQHLAETRPDRDAPPGEREAWPDFLIELAAIELAMLDVSDGPGLEGSAAPSAADIYALPGKRLLRARLSPAPCLRLFACKWPVRAYLLAVRGGESPELPLPSDTFVAVCRREFRVTLHETAAQEHALLEALDGRRTVGEALELARGGGEAERGSVGAVKDWLCVGAARGYFAALEEGSVRAEPTTGRA